MPCVVGPRQNRMRRVRHARRAVPARVFRRKGLHLQAARRRPGEAAERSASFSTPLVALVNEVRYVPIVVFMRDWYSPHRCATLRPRIVDMVHAYKHVRACLYQKNNLLLLPA